MIHLRTCVDGSRYISGQGRGQRQLSLLKEKRKRKEGRMRADKRRHLIFYGNRGKGARLTAAVFYCCMHARLCPFVLRLRISAFFFNRLPTVSAARATTVVEVRA